MKNDITLNDLYPVIKEILDSGSVYEFAPNGNSMYPLFKDGKTEVTLSKADNVEIGDIVLCKTDDGSFILHRVDEITGLGFILRGDNLLTREGVFKKENIVGKVISYKKSGREKKLCGPCYRFYMRVILPWHRYKLRIIRKLRVNKK